MIHSQVVKHTEAFFLPELIYEPYILLVSMALENIRPVLHPDTIIGVMLFQF